MPPLPSSNTSADERILKLAQEALLRYLPLEMRLLVDLGKPQDESCIVIKGTAWRVHPVGFS